MHILNKDMFLILRGILSSIFMRGQIISANACKYALFLDKS